jgi:hypothetical protein
LGDGTFRQELLAQAQTLAGQDRVAKLNIQTDLQNENFQLAS